MSSEIDTLTRVTWFLNTGFEIWIKSHQLTPSELLLKEPMDVRMTPAEQHLTRDRELELPGRWVAAWRRQEGKTN